MLDIVSKMPATMPGKNPTMTAVAGNLLQLLTSGRIWFVAVDELEVVVDVGGAVEVPVEVEVAVGDEELEAEEALAWGTTDWSTSIEQWFAELQL